MKRKVIIREKLRIIFNVGDLESSQSSVSEQEIAVKRIIVPTITPTIVRKYASRSNSSKFSVKKVGGICEINAIPSEVNISPMPSIRVQEKCDIVLM
ncbi:MAG: hypothetical protein KAR20_02785 [Candidatus Heimdallarchaeota archaeon]|nr:hypothetical protein [Candidatus Heimdallarchaeota archaeon]